MNTLPAMIDHGLGRNNLRALSLAFTPGLAMVPPAGVSLDKTNPVCGMCMVAQPGEAALATHWDTCQPTPAKRSRTPWYPLQGHREGLHRNDLITLHSAFAIMAMAGGTAHLVAPVHTPDPCETCGT